MPRFRRSAHSKQVIVWFFLLIAAIILFLFWRIVAPFAVTLLTAGIFAIVLTPFDGKLKKIFKKESVSAVFTLILATILVFLPLAIILTIIAQQASDLVRELSSEKSIVRQIDITQFGIYELMPKFLQEQIGAIDFVEVGKSGAEWIAGQSGQILSTIAKFVLNIFIFFIALYYFLADRKHIHKVVLELSPFNDKTDENLVKGLIDTVRSVFSGALLIALTQSIIASIGLTIAGVPGALLWGSLVLIASQIPVVGVSAVMGPAILYLVFIGATGPAIFLLIWSVLAVGLIDNLLSPYLLGSKTNLPSMWILISILGALQILGPIGIIIGPTILALVVVLMDLYRAGVLEGRVK